MQVHILIKLISPTLPTRTTDLKVDGRKLHHQDSWNHLNFMTININKALRSVKHYTYQPQQNNTASCQRQCSIYFHSFNSRYSLSLLGAHSYSDLRHCSCLLFYFFSTPLSLHLLLVLSLRSVYCQVLVFLFGSLMFSTFTLFPGKLI